jgi:hypothetical protein
MKDLITPPVPPPRPDVLSEVTDPENGKATGKIIVDGVVMATWEGNSVKLCRALAYTAKAFYECTLTSQCELVEKARGKPLWMF